MSLRIFNTQTKKKEEFLPIQEGKVGIYVCGITAYDVCHVGHARSAVVFDVITRYLRYRGYEVTYVKNFTDVDDKIIEKASRERKGITEISERYIREHNEDMEALGVAVPTATPRATEHIDGMIRLVATLIEKGLAYGVDGDIYYAVEKFPEYGKLSGRRLEDMLAGARIDVNDKKRNPYDFTLWKASKEGEPWWESPWGRGRPGWHLECSVMSQRYLGDTFDIHGGGEDLVFPHHENEIAQSEGASGKPLARYWVHNGFVRVNSEKMSKSLGNFFTIRDILEQYHPEVLRLFMMQSHYRSPVDFSDVALNEARQGMDRFYSTLKTIRDLRAAGVERTDPSGESSEKDRELTGQLQNLRERFIEAMDDDFNTARAIGYLFDTIRFLNASLTGKKAEASASALDQTEKTLHEIGAVLGLLLAEPDDYMRLDRDREVVKRGLAVAEIEASIADRWSAREKKEWQKADEIRKSLAARGVILKDTPTATTWTIA
ncbi:MAG: cysteine--tRNA ligase [Syntrophus sp. RIFOXYC2_FULL_54_9]|nr:MAG: cysteine--tRNA ligase [Syntrophus sp. GWC2_56_31]OHE31859.1 MAG: cysteine--tRNA ligase [Syntrophus sp. RIFOXYC2_FULL_54_9]